MALNDISKTNDAHYENNGYWFAAKPILKSGWEYLWIQKYWLENLYISLNHLRMNNSEKHDLTNKCSVIVFIFFKGTILNVWKLASKSINNRLAICSICFLGESFDNLEFLETAWRFPNNLFMRNTRLSIKI